MERGTIIKKTRANRIYLYSVQKVQKVNGLDMEFYWGLRISKDGSIDARGDGGRGILKVICDDRQLARGKTYEVVE